MRIEKKVILTVTIFVTFILLILTLPYTTMAGSLPDTGQTKCYDDTQEITCPSPGQPFYGQDAQYSTYPQSYTKLNENGYALPHEAPSWVMVRDNVTGLIWEVKQNKDSTPDYENPHDADNTYSWYDGDTGSPGDGTDTLDFINDLNAAQFGGFDDWRMPTIKELSFIRNMDTWNPAIDTSYFPNTRSDRYWSSTTWVDHPVYAWRVLFSYGGVVYVPKAAGVYVRAVRAGQSGSFCDFRDNLDGTVTDMATGLMWEQKTVGNMSDTYNWQGALAYCEGLPLAGYDDWRLPDVNEIQSIGDYSTYNPSIDTIYFPNIVSNNYRSSTTRDLYPEDAYYVYFETGPVNLKSKSISQYVRCVRDGASLKLDVDQDGNPEDPAKILLCEGETGSLDIWLTHWTKPDNVTAVDYFLTWDTDALQVVDITCNNPQWDVNCSATPQGDGVSLLQVESSSGVSGPDMKLQTVTLNSLTTPCSGLISAQDTWVSYVGCTTYGAGDTNSSANTVCEEVEIDCTTQNCDVCTEICPPSVVPENDYYFWEPMDAGTEKCEGETISVFRTKTASYEVTQPISGDVCDSGVFNQCLEDYVWFKIQPCYLKCTHGCQNAFCEHLDEEAVCDTYQRKVDGNTYCYESCLGGSCSYDKECGFEIDETIYVKDSNGTCAGSVVESYQLRGDCTAVKDIPLPLVTSTHYYDICTETNEVIATFTVEDCGVTCSISVPENFLVVKGVDDSLEVTVTNDSASPIYYDLFLKRWSNDGHTDPMEIPDSLDVQENILVGAHSSETFNITATNPQPEEGETHWDNIIIKAAASCESIFDYDIRVDTDGDGIPNDEDNCWEVGNPDQTDSNDNCPDPPYSTDPLCGDACESLNQCVCDFDDDGNVYPSDLSVFLGEYGRTDCLISPSCEADFDDDGNVYPSDLSVFLGEYGRTDCLP